MNYIAYMSGYRRAKCRKGFTLVETMIVVSIIGLLSAVAIPSVRTARIKSQEVTKERNVRMLNDAVEIWAMDAFVGNGTPIDESITNYIKKGLEGLKVGSSQPHLTNITGRVVGHVFTVDDLY